MCEKVVENHLKPSEVYGNSRGDHLNDVVFHIYNAKAHTS